MNLLQEICNTFNKHAHEYEKNAKVQTEIGTRLFDRLNYLTMQPKYILDLGCGSGHFSRLLKQRYPKAQIVSIDLAHDMLLAANNKKMQEDDFSLVEGSMQKLPFADGVFDLIFANQVLHWTESLPEVFRELNRIMHEGACLMFTTLGPDTFKEIRQAWSHADAFEHANAFLDMHIIGDYLLAERLLEPVVDMEMLAVHYKSVSALTQSLKAQGVRNVNKNRNRGLTGKQAWKAFEAAYAVLKTPEGKYPLTYEVIYGHAWKGTQRVSDKGIETSFPLSRLR